MVIFRVLFPIFFVYFIYIEGMIPVNRFVRPQTFKISKLDRPTEGEPRIIRAARLGNWKKVISLYEKGYPIDDRNTQGQTALHIAASNNDIEMAVVLLQRQASPNARCRFGLTPLHMAVMNGYSGMTKLLLEFGARHDEKTNYDETPLQLATVRGYAKIVFTLIEKSEFIRIQSSHWLTPQKVLNESFQGDEAKAT